MKVLRGEPRGRFFGQEQLKLIAVAFAIPLLSVPYVILPGAVYAALIIIFASFCWFTISRKIAVLVLALHAYQVTVCLIDSNEAWELRDLNSQLMVQSAMGFVILAIADIKRQWILTIAALVVWVGVLSAALEWRGVDLISHLPSRAADSLTAFVGPVTYGADVRLRGVYPESSALGAVLGGFAFLLVAGAASEWKSGRKLIAGLFAASALVGLSGLAFLLTKAGLAIVFGGVAAFLLALPFALGRLGVLISAAVILSTAAVSGIVFFALPIESKEYIYSEIESVQSMLAGGDVRAVKGRGVYGRTEGFAIAGKSLIVKPFGGAPSEIMAIVESKQITITEEMMFYFNNGIYGLKSTVANVAVRAGIVGLILLATLIATAFQVRETIRRGKWLLLQGATFIAVSIAFLVVIEDRYFYFAFILLLASVHNHALQERTTDQSRRPLLHTEPRRNVLSQRRHR
jgi:hypothetical protein